MKKILAMIMAVAILASMFAVSVSATAPAYTVSVDSVSGQKSKDKDNVDPTKHYVVVSEIEEGSTLDITGWMVMEAGFSKLQYSVDGGAWTDATATYAARPDVISHVEANYPNVNYTATNDTPGFGTAVMSGIASLKQGSYSVEVRGVDKNGASVNVLTVTLTVKGEIVVPDPTVITLDEDATMYKYCGNVQGGADTAFDFLDGKPTAIQFKVPAGKAATQFVFLASPTWSNTAAKNAGSDVLCKIYAWNKDYDTTIAGNPLDTLQIYGHADCQNLIIEFSKSFKTGEYLLVLDANGGKSIGTWSADAGTDSTTFYANGAVKDGYIAQFAAMLVDAAPETEAPQTGDMTVAMFAVLAVVALAAVVVLKKRVNA